MKTEKIMTVIQTHSSGETTKVVVSGFPQIFGKTMWEKTKYVQRGQSVDRAGYGRRPGTCDKCCA